MKKIRTALVVICMMAVGFTAHATNITEINGIPIQAKTGATFFVAASDYPDPNSADYVCDGTDDDVQIQAAIDAAAALTPPGSVELSSGDFGIDAHLVLPASVGIHLFGQGQGSTQLNANTAMDEVIQHTGDTVATNMHLNGFSIDGNLNAGNGLSFDVGKGWVIEDLYITEVTTAGIKLNAPWGTTTNRFYEGRFRNLWIHGGYPADPDDRPIYGIYITSSRVSDNHFTDIVVTNVKTAGIYDGNSGGSVYDIIHVYGYPSANEPQYCMDVAGGVTLSHIYADSYTEAGINVRGDITSIIAPKFNPTSALPGVKIATGLDNISIIAPVLGPNCNALYSLGGTTPTNFLVISSTGGILLPGSTTVGGTLTTGTGIMATTGNVTASAGSLSATNSSTPLSAIRTSTTDTNYVLGAASLGLKNSSGNMADGFGPGLYWSIEDSAAVQNTIFLNSVVRDGSDVNGAYRFQPYSWGGYFEAARITSNGLLGLFDTSPSANISVKNPTSSLVYFYNGSTSSYTKNTTEATTTGGTPFTLLADDDPVDYTYIRGPYPSGGANRAPTSLYFDIATAAVGTTLVWQYADGVDESSVVNHWNTLTVTDGTAGFTKSGPVTWTMPTDWVSGKVNSQTGYWMRVYSSTEPTTDPTAFSISCFSGNKLDIYQNYSDTTPAFSVRNDGSTALRKKVRTDTAASVTLSADDVLNGLCVNGDDDVIDYTLPDASPASGSLVGATVRFYAGTYARVITVDTYDTNDTIVLNGTSLSAGNAIDSPGAAGAIIELTCIAPGIWIAPLMNSIWVDGGAD